AGNIDQHAAGHEAAHMLNAELGESAARPNVLELVAIVKAVAPHLMRERVELSADLAKLGDDELFVDLATIRYRRRRLGVNVELPAFVDECGLRIRRQHRAELEDFAGADQPGGTQHGLGSHEVARAALVL